MRTPAQVMAARRTPTGCCERYCDNMACDCLELAELRLSEWQQYGRDEWMFGVKVRGFVRNEFGDIYFDEDQIPPWIWMTKLIHGPGENPRGECNTLQEAVEAVEKALGVA